MILIGDDFHIVLVTKLLTLALKANAVRARWPSHKNVMSWSGNFKVIGIFLKRQVKVVWVMHPVAYEEEYVIIEQILEHSLVGAI